MQPFQYIEPKSLDEAVALLAAQPGETQLIAGGSDLLSEIKEGVAAPRRLVSLAGIPGLRGIRETGGGLELGAMTTIAELAQHPAIRACYTALAQAAEELATPQIRNVGTLGGNLAQRPRCWYYRHPQTVCLKKGGDRCYALAGVSKYLCVTGGDRCYIVHPSDTAVALSVFDARVEIAGPRGTRTMPIGEFFIGPGQDLLRENGLEPGELVTRVLLPGQDEIPLGPPLQRGVGGISVPVRSLYLKARERETGDFALVSVAVAVALEGDTIRQARVCLGGVAPVPYRARPVEEYLRGQQVADVDAAHAGSLALPNPRPMADNGYKVPLTANLVTRAVGEVMSGG
ncbi:MAG: xanthine dehydrogenase family protein subunit M [Dehalococcoidia bacterium]|nr:xanthine dehydrogenase family protein subunit M [Dehalococcoidia bacterium]MSQ16674.1 xanthine dehydrogenase family protein subunit M [Dehalococcoidia bacterium]